MTGTLRTGGTAGRFPHLSLNSDGRPHPLLTAASVFTLIAGLVSFALGLFIRSDPSSGHGTAIAAGVTGLAALVTSLYIAAAVEQSKVEVAVGGDSGVRVRSVGRCPLGVQCVAHGGQVGRPHPVGGGCLHL
jgi:hypothetical protein